MARVSIATVSNVINETRAVRPETKQRVLAAIAALHYVPDSTARHFKAGRKSAVGFIVPDICNTFFSTLIDSVEEVLEAGGYDLVIANTREDPAREACRLRRLCAGTVDALLIASCFETYVQLAAYLPEGFPVVLIDRLPAGSQCDTIRTDAHAAIGQSIDALAAAGHRKIGMLAWQENLSTTRERIDAFRHAAGRHDFEAPVRCAGIDGGAAYAAEELLADGCTALLIGNSKLYVELTAFLAAAKPCPAVVCFCDSPEYEHLFRGAAMICQPTQELGRLAGRMILERFHTPDARTRDVILQCAYHP